ncbi:MAG: sigma-70 family RNA polymerase sigma factor [Acholeplasmatales bacterium]|nr:sigma-70 family RNA polymerase sigma factor [Acholeplasmatales bacterium]
MFVNYNDYELLYLINDEGSEQAFDILYKKYDFFIKNLVRKYMFDSDKRDDLYQEGLLVLLKCIYSFREDANVSFYSYLYVSLNRRFSVLKKRDNYYVENTFIDKVEIIADQKKNNPDVLSYYEKLLKSQNNEMGLLYLEDCINKGSSLNTFAKDNNISYYKASKIKAKVIKEIKKRY